ncbi:hypothetical protein [Microlunatus speluncae]|uniref:hypothetical protein n=1 Tax=Microlunatus speluncae TaxID=2594267 RepID=UPI00126659CB|nr:hypothetical protein [Microlunatus speluncae]
MITVYLDRDSVAMGDDVVPHSVAWEFEDSAAPGDVLARVLSERYLARVAGPVAWGFEVGAFTVQHYPEFIAIEAVQTVTAAAVLQPSAGTWQVVPLRARVLTIPFLDRPDWAVADRQFAVDLRYSTEGAARDPETYVSWLGRHR